VRELAIGLDPTIPVTTLTLADLQRQADAVTRLVMLAMVLIIVSVMLLSAAGIYALMSFTVTQRRKEIGIRAAMGASAAQLLRGIFTRAAAQIAAGVATGIVLAMSLDAASGGEALGPGGTITLPAISALMIVVGLAAALAPARRGLRIQPTEALRDL
jgi:ABC-type antimicrobial peptide transport system permease subunit